jgi:hypothetical protein
VVDYLCRGDGSDGLGAVVLTGAGRAGDIFFLFLRLALQRVRTERGALLVVLMERMSVANPDWLRSEASLEWGSHGWCWQAFSAGGDLEFLRERAADTPSRNAVIMRRFYERFLSVRALLHRVGLHHRNSTFLGRRMSGGGVGGAGIRVQESWAREPFFRFYSVRVWTLLRFSLVFVRGSCENT